MSTFHINLTLILLNFFQYLGTLNPERYQVINKHYDEIFLVLSGLAQNYYLSKNGKHELKLSFDLSSHLHNGKITFKFQTSYKLEKTFSLTMIFRCFTLWVILWIDTLQLKIGEIFKKGSCLVTSFLGGRSVYITKARSQDDKTKRKTAGWSDNRGQVRALEFLQLSNS